MTRTLVSGLYLYMATDRAIQRGQLLTRRTVEAVPTVADASVLQVSKASILLFYSLLDEQQRRLYADSNPSNWAAVGIVNWPTSWISIPIPWLADDNNY